MITTLATLTIPFIVLFILNSSMIMATGKTFGKCLPVTMMGIVYILFISQIFFNTFLYGFILIGLFPVVVLVLMIIHRLTPECDLIITDGLTVFIIIYIFFNILNFNKWVLICDEFTHWGPMVKEMVRLDRFYCVSESVLGVHKEYPPFLSLFEFFWIKICGCYSEMGTTTALNVFQFSIITAPFIEKKSAFMKDDWLRVLFKFFALFLIVVIFDPYCVLTTVYKDLALPMTFCYSISLLIDGSAVSSPFALISFAMTMGALVMTKELGIAFAVLAILAFVICGFRTLRLKRISAMSFCIGSITVIIIPALMKLCWKFHISKYLDNNSGQFSLSKISSAVIFDIVSGKDNGIRRTVLFNYIKALIKEPVSNIMSVTYCTSFVIVILLLFILWRRYSYKFNIMNAVGFAILFTVGTLGFALTIGILYLFCFSEEEMLILTSYSRYMSSYVLGEVLVLMIIFITLWVSEKDIRNYNKKIAIILALVFLITFAPATTTWIPQSMRKGPFKTVNAEVSEQAYEYSKLLSEHTEEGSRILILPGNSGWFIPTYIRYLLNDRIIEWDENFDNTDLLTGKDYLLIEEADTEMIKLLSPLCKGGKIEDNIIYRVVDDNGDLRLVETE